MEAGDVLLKRDAAYRMLSHILDNEHLKLHKKCLTEIESLIFGTGQESDFIKKLTRRIDKLLKDGYKAIGTEGLEKLGYTSDLYSMHVDTQSLNIRILFALGESNLKLLLLAFHEKEGKGKTDYSQKIPTAKQRLNELNDA